MLKSRRIFLKIGLFSGLAALLTPWRARAVGNAAKFNAGSYSATLSTLFGERTITPSELIDLQIPAIAENGAVVPITISSELENIERLWILVEKNPTPLAAELVLSGPALPYLTTRIKMAESCAVLVIADSGGQLLATQRWVQVMLGGCGTG